MTMTDPIADMLTRIRNANVAMHDEVSMPSSKRKLALAEVLRREGYIASFAERDNAPRPGKTLTIEMKYSPERDRVIRGLRRISKPRSAHLPEARRDPAGPGRARSGPSCPPTRV